MPIFAGAIAGVARAGAATMGFAKRGAVAGATREKTTIIDDGRGSAYEVGLGKREARPQFKALGRGLVYGGVAYAGHKAVNRGEKAQRKWLQ